MPMSIDRLLRDLDVDAAGERMVGFIEEVYPICRSITGDGVRETLKRVRERL